MPKPGELTYLEKIGAKGINHAVNKPFLDGHCGGNLIAIGIIRMLMPQPPARLLDLGCGTGWTSWFFAKMGYEVVGQDIAPDMIHYATVNKQRYQVDNATFTVSDYENLTYQEEFDCALFFDSLHHAEDERLALKKTFEALKPGGICITHEPGEGHAVAPHSRNAVEKYNVTEKDMPPYKIKALGLEVGFSKVMTYPLWDMIIERYHQHLNGKAVPKQPGSWRRWLASFLLPKNTLKRLNDILIMNDLLQHSSYDRDCAIVVLTKS